MLTGAPKITSDLSIRDMTVIAGEEFTITVPYVSNPTPRPTWTINGQEVISDSRIEFKTSANSTVFHNKCAKRATDSGSYTIQLVNNMGSDSASCRVLVVGEFLLYFKAIKAETCSGITLFYFKMAKVYLKTVQGYYLSYYLWLCHIQKLQYPSFVF